MFTISEIAVTAAIWCLAAVGGFFGIRAAMRKKKLKRDDPDRGAGKLHGNDS